MSKRDQILLLFMIVAGIGFGGFKVLIEPAQATTKTLTDTRENTQTQVDTTKIKIARIPAIQEERDNAYENFLHAGEILDEYYQDEQLSRRWISLTDSTSTRLYTYALSDLPMYKQETKNKELSEYITAKNFTFGIGATYNGFINMLTQMQLATDVYISTFSVNFSASGADGTTPMASTVQIAGTTYMSIEMEDEEIEEIPQA